MFDKKELRTLTVPQLPKKRTDAVYRAKGVMYLAKSRMALDGKLLIVAFYERESAANRFSLPSAVLFQTKDDFITLFSKDGKKLWRTSRIMGQLDVPNPQKEIVFLNKHDETRVRSFLQEPRKLNKWETDDTGSRIDRYQDYICTHRLEERLKKQYQEILDKIGEAPAIPDDYQDWVHRGALDKQQYIFYKRSGKKKADAYCAVCKKEMVIEKNVPVHLEAGNCPLCGHPVIFKSIGRSVYTSDKIYTSLLQEVNDGEYVLRYFENVRTFKPAPYAIPDNGIILALLPEISQTEVARVYFNGEGDVTDQFKQKSKIWQRTHKRIIGDRVEWEFRHYNVYLWHYWFEPGYLYPNNLIPLFDKLGIGYDLKDEVCHGPINVTTPILQHVKYPFLGSMKAMGLKTLCEDILKWGNRFAKSKRDGKLHECLSVHKSFISIIQKHKLDVMDVDLATSYGVELTEEDFLWLASENPSMEFMSFFLQFCSVTDARQYLMEKMNQMRKYNKYEYKLEKQMTWWRDYLQMCLRMDYDMGDRRILYPYNLKEAHTYVMKMSNEKPNPKWDKKIAGCYERLYSFYHFEKDGYIITPPKNYTEFAVEGNTLLHCVCKNQYYIKHVSGTNLIFFVRKAAEPGKPLYTIEYIPKEQKVAQFYGYDHQHPDSEARAFIADWKYFIRNGGGMIKVAA